MPGRVNADDLPARLRSLVVNPGAGAQPGKEDSPQPAATASKVKATRWRCHTCDDRFTAWAPAERHVDTTRHLRIDMILDGRVTPNADYAGTCSDCQGPCEMAELPVFMRPYWCRHVTDADRRIRDAVAPNARPGAGAP